MRGAGTYLLFGEVAVEVVLALEAVGAGREGLGLVGGVGWVLGGHGSF